jgi:hypothetical protein
LDIDDNDRGIATEIREKLRINLTGPPGREGLFAEASWQQFNATTGNALVVVPVGPESFAFAEKGAT